MGRAGMRQTVVDMNRIIYDARSDLQLEVEGREIAWKVEALSKVLKDPSMLRLVVGTSSSTP